MPRSSASLNSSYFLLLSSLLFFFNSALWGGKLSLILLLTPLWLFLSQNSKAGTSKWALLAGFILILYFPIHHWHGIASLMDYGKSLLILLSLLLFINVASYYTVQNEQLLDTLFRKLLIINGLLVLFSIPLLWMDELKGAVWYIISISDDMQPIPRLKLFTPEASHYSLIFSPIFIYFWIRLLMFKVKNSWLIILLTTLPLLLSFSLGVLAALCISFLILLILKYRQGFMEMLPPRKLVLIGVVILLGLILLYYLFPDNPLYHRVQNLFEGKDTSGRGRTYEAFILGDKVAALKDRLWGIGPGQLKLIGRDTIVQYYFYFNIPVVIRIPNATAETLAYYGYSGLALRILLELFLFFKTKVYSNPFRMWLFLFLFIYQLTGSYINNGYEYMIWILVFTPVFKDLNFTKSIGS